jgi:hypothetical protein
MSPTTSSLKSPAILRGGTRRLLAGGRSTSPAGAAGEHAGQTSRRDAAF